jgi:alanine dehydrogenase
MQIGCPAEIKPQEYRVGLVPEAVRELVARGHDVLVETGCGAAINFIDDDYRQAGAVIADTPKEIFDQADMIIKVKEPQPSECKMLRRGQILFTFLHLAADMQQARGLMDAGAVAIAFETVVGDDARSLPLLAPMSEIAGRLAAQAGAHYLQKHLGGTGRLIGGIPGTHPARILILGGGVSGFNSARVATGMGAQVTILERDPKRMRALDDYFRGRAEIVYSNADNIERLSRQSDCIIGAVLIPGASAPKLVTRDMLASMQAGATLVDVAIDQGGCFETSQATTHDEPVYTIDGINHYCVANMPGAVPLTSALALNHAILPYVQAIADKGWQQALRDDPRLQAGLNVVEGRITHESVANSLSLDYVSAGAVLAA